MARTWPRSTSSFSIPLRSTPTLSPAIVSSRVFLNISRPVTTVFLVSLSPTISISSFTFNFPRSTRPVTTVPRPLMAKTSSIGIRKGFSVSLTGSGIYSSTAFISSRICFSASASPSKAFRAEPLMTGTSSPGYSYFLSSSLISCSTKSTISGSSTVSTLFKKTIIAGTLTCLAKMTCSEVWGIFPSAAETTKIAPSI
ncbi:MAG: hypothetical protein UW60_C0012G0005 [Candidatus Woesebacteria bacterium GW2011_GWA2_44_33]|uniref:Uncharacterized protein n=1 Tax=Candidatus Woesebacteria bacterium GW2011_GWA2_44_33 TaxID=1618564 RepID=A0A0G1M5C5_9BACT|nr:MAG: hypothetical protein UW60_C0012G0005 [Candidatus Woesebacteria bacterium GW2011_GWA2_44_33]